MKIWVDADACPKPVKDMLFRAAERRKIEVILVANAYLHLAPSAYVRFMQVEQGPDIADDKIAALCTQGDLVITADIPLAVRAIEKGATALDPRGTLYTKNNIGGISDMRDFMHELRGTGIETGGPKSFGQREKLAFANELDKFLARN